MINVYVISGFLGSGKTTFIQKLLAEKKFEKVMLLENEFGQVGVDSAFFSSSLNVKEINNGCICCSLQGDFEAALSEIEAMGVSDLIIEPSGVGKLSDIMGVIINNPNFRIVSHICIVDVKTAKKYHTNFKEYFDDQVKSANALVLSHTDVCEEEKIHEVIHMLEDLNDDANIIENYNKYSIEELLDIIVAGGEIVECCCHHHHDEDEECCCHHHHHDEDEDDDEECCCHHHEHECCDDEECECHHHHDEDEEHHHHHHHHHHDEDEDDEDELFKNVIIRPEYIFKKEELEEILAHMPEDIIRVKGYVKSDKGTLYFNYVLNEYHTYIGEDRDGAIVSVIGTELHKDELRKAFHE